ncbi:MAG: hypothetical protein ACI90Q_001328, partial [Nonlabens sp.]
ALLLCESNVVGLTINLQNSIHPKYVHKVF